MADQVGALAPVVALFGRRDRGADREPRLTKLELADHFRVHPRTIERWMRDPAYRKAGRGLPFDKPFDGAPVTFKLSECEAWYRGEAA